MKSLHASAIELLHKTDDGSLATLSVSTPGYPFVTALPFAPDLHHRPLFLISGLAEHTRNLIANPRASFLITDPQVADKQAAPRLTLIGESEPLAAEDPLLRRYLRYRPEAAGYVDLPDFTLVRLNPIRFRMIQGFARVGWIEAIEIESLPILSSEAEENLLRVLQKRVPDDWKLLGIDRLGLDLSRPAKRERVTLAAVPLTDDEIETAAHRALVRFFADP